jgi:Na+/H+ antiporter NhaD/arsenite permease-like protein
LRAALSPVVLLAALMLILGCLILYFTITGWRVVLRTDSSKNEVNPLRPYTLQILGLTFVLPALMVVSSVEKLSPEAISALLGSIITFIFGTGFQRPSDKPGSDGSRPPKGTPNSDVAP